MIQRLKPVPRKRKHFLPVAPSIVMSSIELGDETRRNNAAVCRAYAGGARMSGSFQGAVVEDCGGLRRTAEDCGKASDSDRQTDQQIE